MSASNAARLMKCGGLSWWLSAMAVAWCSIGRIWIAYSTNSNKKLLASGLLPTIPKATRRTMAPGTNGPAK